MDTMLEQRDELSGYDFEYMYKKFSEAYNTMEQFGTIYTLRTKPGNIAFLVAFVHPEVMTNPQVRNMVYRVTPGTNELSPFKNNDTNLIRTYVGDGTKPNAKFVKLLEDLRSGVIMTALEGNRRAEGETSDSSAASTEQFIKQASSMASKIDNNPAFTCKSKVSAALKGSNGGTDPSVAIINDAIDWNSLFGYTRDTVPGYTPEDKANEWKRLQILEHWYINAVLRNIPQHYATKTGTDTIKESDIVYALANKYSVFISENPEVVELFKAFNEVYGASFDEAAIRTVAKKLNISTESSIGQTAAFFFLRPDNAKEALDTIIARYPDKAQDFRAAFDKIAQLRAGFMKGLPIPMNEWKESHTLNQIKEYQSTNKDAATLATNNKNTGMSPALTSFRYAKYGEKFKSPNESFIMCKFLGMLLDNPSLIPGLVKDPENVPDEVKNIGNGAAPATADTDSEVAEVSKDPDAEMKEYTSGKRAPYDIAADYLGDNEDNVFNRISNNKVGRERVAVREISPDSDVTGAVVLPNTIVPMFAVSMNYPRTTSSLEAAIYKYGMTMCAAAVIYASKQGNLGYTDWMKSITSENDENDVYVTIERSILLDTDLGSGKFLETLRTDIEKCFAQVASMQPANAVYARNKWVEYLVNREKWGKITSTIFRFITDVIAAPLMDEDNEIELASVYEDIRIKLGRLVFDVKVGSVDYTIPGESDLVVHDAKPYDPINSSENGRLRKSGGIEGSVTEIGQALIAATSGKVTQVKTTQEETGRLYPYRPKDDPMNPTDNPMKEYTTSRKFAISFGNKSIGADDVPESQLETWQPNVLVTAEDPDDRSLHYAMWIGIQFCSIITDEGPENVARYPKDIVQASNRVFGDDMSYGGVINSPKTPPEATAVMQALGTTNGVALDAVSAMHDACTDSGKMEEYGNVIKLIADAVQKAPAADRNGLMAKFTVDALCRSGKPANMAAADAIVSIADSLYFGRVGDAGDDDSYKSMSTVLEYCRDASAAPYERLIRAYSAMNSLLSVAFTANDNSPVYVGDCAFTAKCEDDRVSLTVTHQRLNYAIRHPEIDQILRSTVADARNKISRTIDHLSAEEGDVEFYYNTAMNALESLTAGYGYSLVTDMRLNDSPALESVFTALVNPDTKKVFGEFVNAVAKTAGSVDELGNQNVCDLFNAMGQVDALGTSMDKFKDIRGINKYNASRGNAAPNRLTGDEVADVPGMQVDDIGEGDVEDMHPLHKTLHGDMDDFDAAANTDYQAVTNFPMLGLVKCDEMGMHTGQDNFSITEGLNPSEFERVLLALDDSHNEIMKSMNGVRGKNIPLRELMKRKYNPIDMFIDCFYGFMTSGQRMDRRKVISEAYQVAAVARRIASECFDDAIKDDLVHCADMFDELVDKVATEIPEQYDTTVEVNTEAAKILGTGIANIVLYLNGLNTPESVPGNYGGLEQYGAAGAGRNPMGNAGLYTTLSAMPSVVNKKGKSRIQSKLNTDTNQLVSDAMQVGTRGDARLVRTIAEFYKLLGRANTAGYNESITPYTDLLKKLAGKEKMSYRRLYTGQASTTLGAAIVWAICEDENSATEGYDALDNIVNDLLNGEAVYIPEFLVSGVKATKDEVGNRKLNINNLVPVTFNASGKATYDPEGNDRNAKEFTSVEDIWATANFKASESVKDAIVPPQGVDDLAADTRLAILSNKFDNGRIVQDLRRDSADTNASVYEDVIENTRNEILGAATKIKTTGEDFVPFPVLYACIDESYLNASMSAVTSSAVDTINRKAANTVNREMYRNITGHDANDIEERLDETVHSHEADIIYALANALAQAEDGTLDDDTRDEVLNTPRANPSDPDGDPIPDSSLNVILGSKAGQLVDMFIERYADKVTDDMSEGDYARMASEFINSMFYADPADDKRMIAKTLTNMVYGTVQYEDGIKSITAMIGARTPVIAEELYSQLLKVLGTPGAPSKAAQMPRAKVLNKAIRIVNIAGSASNEFRNIYRSGHKNQRSEFNQARIDTHGLPPTPTVEKIGGIDGLQVLFKKTVAALSGKMTEETAAQYLTAVRFNIDNRSGSGAIQRFNEIVDRLTTDIRELIISTCNGIAETISLRSEGAEGENGEALHGDNWMGESAFDRQNSGSERRGILNKLVNDMSAAKKSAGYTAPEKNLPEDRQFGTGKWNNNGINGVINYIVNEYCTWDPSKSDEELSGLIEELASDKLLDHIDSEIKHAVAKVYASSDKLYAAGVASIVNAASTFRGVASEVDLDDATLEKVLKQVAGRPSSPIMEDDTDQMEGGYTINGVNHTKYECMAILRDAIRMFSETTGKPISQIVPSDYNTKDFMACIRKCSTMNKDYGLTSKAITELFLGNMLATGRYTLSNRLDYGFTWNLTRKVPGRDSRASFRFDVPMDLCRSVVEQQVKNLKPSASANQWRRFAEDFVKFTNPGNRANEAEITNPTLKSDLVNLFNAVNRNLLTKMDNALGEVNIDHVMNNQPETSRNGIIVSRTGYENTRARNMTSEAENGLGHIDIQMHPEVNPEDTEEA